MVIIETIVLLKYLKKKENNRKNTNESRMNRYEH